ncbi:MAG TPA: ABC transporter permease [Gemmatimonadales bacterium]|nr:ABC transporter permease [Gemmatimonadales bacterium]
MIVERWESLWHSRGLVREFALRDLRVRYHQAALGVLWALLMPVLVVLTGLVLRLVVAQSSGAGDGVASLGGIVVRAVPWSFFAGALGFATSSLTANGVLISKVYFPREALPVATVAAQGVDLAVGLVMASVVLAFVGVTLSVQMLWAIPLLITLVLLTTGVSLIAACANLFFRDVRYLVQVFLTFGVFFTPVFYDATRLGATGARIVMLNPLSPILEGLRLSVADGHSLLQPLVVDGIAAWSPWMLVYPAVFAAGSLLVASVLYSRLELSFAEYL